MKLRTTLCEWCGKRVLWVSRAKRRSEARAALADISEINADGADVLPQRWASKPKTPPCLECIEHARKQAIAMAIDPDSW